MPSKQHRRVHLRLLDCRKTEHLGERMAPDSRVVLDTFFEPLLGFLHPLHHSSSGGPQGFLACASILLYESLFHFHAVQVSSPTSIYSPVAQYSV